MQENEVLKVQVTTSRSKCNFKPAIVCLEDPLIKLDGMGAKTMTRLQQVQQCIQTHDPEGSVPEVALDKVDTGRHHGYLHSSHMQHAASL